MLHRSNYPDTNRDERVAATFDRNGLRVFATLEPVDAVAVPARADVRPERATARQPSRSGSAWRCGGVLPPAQV